MLQVAFSLDIRDVDAGNPGIGGTEYTFFPEGVTYHEVRNLGEASAKLEVNGESLLILRELEVLPNLQHLRYLQQKVLVWAHNDSGHEVLKACAGCPNIVRYPSVSREQYEQLRNEPVFAKANYIFSAAVTQRYPAEIKSSSENNVFYMGSLIETKGFHVLARQWKDIVAKVPEAKRNVIDSGQLHDRAAVIGPMGLAAPSYEHLFAKYVNEGGRRREDIIFHGTLGANKTELLRQAKAAVANPTGAGDTFCITAWEFALLGVPVITKNVGGPRNVMSNGVTGILYNHESKLADAVITLLTQDELRKERGRNAPVFARENFGIDVVLKKWIKNTPGCGLRRSGRSRPRDYGGP